MSFTCKTCRAPIGKDPLGDWAHMDDEIVMGGLLATVRGTSIHHPAEPEIIDVTCSEESDERSTGLPWDDPRSDPMGDVLNAMRHAREHHSPFRPIEKKSE